MSCQVLEAALSVSPGNSSSESTPVVLPNLLPKLIKVNSNGANPVLQLLPGKGTKIHSEIIVVFTLGLILIKIIYVTFTDADTQYRDVILKMNYASSTQKWWTALEDCSDQTYQDILKNIPSAGSESSCNQTLLIYTFNDKTFPATLSVFSGKG